MKIYVCGYGRHGKDTVADILQKKLGLKFCSSSWATAERVIYPALKSQYGYGNVNECFNDRHNHRAEWHNLIAEFNDPDLTKLSESIFDDYDIYVGIRAYGELEAAKRRWDDVLVIWVDAMERVPPEDESSCSIKIEQADVVITNHGTEEELYERVSKLCDLLEHANRSEGDRVGEEFLTKSVSVSQ